MAVPRTCGRRPSQRRRPALPHTMALRSGLPVAPNRCPTCGRHTADFSTGERNLRPAGFAGHQCGARAGATAETTAAASLQFDVVDRRAQRDLRQRQAVADGRRCFISAHHHVARFQTVRGNDVALFTVYVVEQRDAGRAIWIVLNRIDLRRNAVLVATEVDKPIAALMATTTVPRRDFALVVAAVGPDLGRSSDFSGLAPGVSSAKSLTVAPRRPGDVGLYLRIPIVVVRGQRSEIRNLTTDLRPPSSPRRIQSCVLCPR